MQEAIHRRYVARVTRVSGNDALGKRIGHANAAGVSGSIGRDVFNSGKRVANRPVARTATEISLERSRKLLFLLVAERCGRHNHSGCTVTALEALRVEEGLLHRVQLAVLGQPLDRRDLFPFGSKCRIETAVYGLFVDPYRARAAIAAVAAFFDAIPAEVPKKNPEALARRWCRGKALTVNRKLHASNSWRICSA